MSGPERDVYTGNKSAWQQSLRGAARSIRIIVTLLIRSVDGKQCYACKVISGGNDSDDCGDFDRRTPQCRVADSGDCMTTTITGSAETILISFLLKVKDFFG